MKRLFKIALAVAFALPVLAACEKQGGGDTPGAVSVTGVDIYDQEDSLITGKTLSVYDDCGLFPISAVIEPENATNKNVIWSSSDGLVAEVQGAAEGMCTVTVKGEGTAEIKVTTEDGGKTAAFTLSVTKKGSEVPVTGVSLDKTALSLVAGESDVLVETVEPANATDKSVLWTSDNNDIATVDNGLVTGVNAGIVTVKVITVDGSFEASCSVTVTPQGGSGEFIPLTAEMISTNNEMQYVTYDFTPQGDWGASTGWINWDIYHYDVQYQAEHGMSTGDWRRARYAQPQNMWDGDYDTCFHTNFDIYVTGGSWAVREGALVADNYIQVELDEPVTKFNLYIRNPMQKADALVGKGYQASGGVGTGVQIKVSDDGVTWKSVTYVDAESGETVECPLDFPTCVDSEVGPYNAEYTWNNLECADIEDIYFIRIQPDLGFTSAGSINGSSGYFGIAELQLYRVD